MINREAIKQLNFTPLQAAAIAMFVHQYNRNTEGLKKLFTRHEKSFTGDPNIDLYQVAHLSKERGRFFDEDFENTAASDPMFSSAKGAFGNLVNNIKDAVSNVVNTVKPIAGAALQVLAPVAGQAANAFAPGSGPAAQGLASSLGTVLSQPKASSQENPNELTPPVQQALQQTYAPGATAPNDNGANALLAALLGKDKEKEEDTGKILGMPKKTFYWVSGGVGLVVVAIIIILIVRNMKKKKKELAAGKK